MNDEILSNLKSKNIKKNNDEIQKEIIILKNSIEVLTNILNKMKNNEGKEVIPKDACDRKSVWESIKNWWR